MNRHVAAGQARSTQATLAMQRRIPSKHNSLHQILDNIKRPVIRLFDLFDKETHHRSRETSQWAVKTSDYGNSRTNSSITTASSQRQSPEATKHDIECERSEPLDNEEPFLSSRTCSIERDGPEARVEHADETITEHRNSGEQELHSSSRAAVTRGAAHVGCSGPSKSNRFASSPLSSGAVGVIKSCDIGWASQSIDSAYCSEPTVSQSPSISETLSQGTNTRGVPHTREPPGRDRNNSNNDVVKKTASGRIQKQNKGKERQSSSGDGNDEEEDQEADGKNLPESRNGGPRLFACPFYRADPIKYADCALAKLTHTNYVRQHIWRVHRGDIQCPTCGLRLPSPDVRDEHIRNRSCSDGEFAENDKADLKYDKALKRPAGCKGDVNIWYSMWSILFPDRRDRPDPYLRNNVGIGDAFYVVSEQFLATQTQERVAALNHLFGGSISNALEDFIMAQLRDRDHGSGAGASAVNAQAWALPEPRQTEPAPSNRSPGSISTDAAANPVSQLRASFQPFPPSVAGPSRIPQQPSRPPQRMSRRGPSHLRFGSQVFEHPTFSYSDTSLVGNAYHSHFAMVPSQSASAPTYTSYANGYHPFASDFQNQQVIWNGSQAQGISSMEEILELEGVGPEILHASRVPATHANADFAQMQLGPEESNMYPATLGDHGQHVPPERTAPSIQPRLGDIEDPRSFASGPNLSETDPTANSNQVWSPLAVDPSLEYIYPPMEQREDPGADLD